VAKNLYELYQPDIEAAARGVPFTTSRGITLWLLPDWAAEWDRCAVDRAILVKDYLALDWWEMPSDLRDRVTVREFETAVVAWDATDAEGTPMPCTVDAKRQVARDIRPLLLEVMAEVRRRREERRGAIVALGKDFAPSSAPSSNTRADESAPPPTVP